MENYNPRSRSKPDTCPAECEDCGRPIIGTYNPDTGTYATRCQVCARGKTNDRAQADYHLRRKYGLSEDEYLALVEAQGNRCAICGCEPSGKPGSGRDRLHVDHDHRTGIVRGLLCADCNTKLGIYERNRVELEALEAYLESPPLAQLGICASRAA